MKLKFLSRTTKKPDALPAGIQGDGAAGLLSSKGEMSFLDHLEDLRWTLIKGFAGVVVMTIVAAFFSDWIVSELLMGPAKGDFFMYRLLGIDAQTLVLQSRNPTGQFFAHMAELA